MKKMWLILVLVVFLFLGGELFPHTHIDINSQNVKKIVISRSQNRSEIDNFNLINLIVKGIKLNRFYKSDIKQIQSSPEKFITLNLKDGTYINIENTGIYSLITHENKTSMGIEIISGEIYITNFFMIDFLSILTQVLT